MRGASAGLTVVTLFRQGPSTRFAERQAALRPLYIYGLEQTNSRDFPNISWDKSRI